MIHIVKRGSLVGDDIIIKEISNNIILQNITFFDSSIIDAVYEISISLELTDKC